MAIPLNKHPCTPPQWVRLGDNANRASDWYLYTGSIYANYVRSTAHITARADVLDMVREFVKVREETLRDACD